MVCHIRRERYPSRGVILVGIWKRAFAAGLLYLGSFLLGSGGD